ncbi:unnamed protein product [Prunus armeniaca]
MEGRGAQRSMSIASLMPWDHMLVIIIFDLENFQRVSPIVLTHGIRRWHQALFTLRKAWRAGFVRSISSMKNESPPLNSITLVKSIVRIPWTLYVGSGIWHWIATMRRMRSRLLKSALAILWQIIEFIWRILALVNFLGCWKL